MKATPGEPYALIFEEGQTPRPVDYPTDVPASDMEDLDFFAHNEKWDEIMNYAEQGYLVSDEEPTGIVWYTCSSDLKHQFNGNGGLVYITNDTAQDVINTGQGNGLRVVRFQRYDPNSLAHAVALQEIAREAYDA